MAEDTILQQIKGPLFKFMAIAEKDRHIAEKKRQLSAIEARFRAVQEKYDEACADFEAEVAALMA